jgi:hypothetical protein
MKLPGFFGGSYQERSIPFDAQRTVNLYPVIDETKQGKEPVALYGTPGMDRVLAVGEYSYFGKFNRMMFASANGRAFMLAGELFFEIFKSGAGVFSKTLINSTVIPEDSTPCTVAESHTQMAICDGVFIYIFTYATNTLALVTDADLPFVSTVTFQDGYFIANRTGTGEFYISGLNDGLSWAALDFATAESSPDPIVRPYSAYGQLWLLGSRTTEVWYNTGDATFPFSRIEGAKMQTGCLAPLSVVDLDNTIFWLGQDKYGKGIIYKAVGYAAKRVSTFAVEYALSQATDLASCRGWAYQDGGHLFYVLTDGGMDSAWVYDTATGLWHERVSFADDSGEWVQWRAKFHMYAHDTHLVIEDDRVSLYEMTQDYYLEDNSDSDREVVTIPRQRIFTHIYDEGEEIRVKSLQIDFEYGQGLREELYSIEDVATRHVGEDAYCWLEISNDLGKTWSPAYKASIGAVGKYKARAIWRKLGKSDSWTFKVSIADPVRVAICGAYINA